MARLMNDVWIDTNDELQVVDGDWAVMESTGIHQRNLLLAVKGDFKEDPTVGVNVFSYIEDEGVSALTQAISEEFARDGMDVERVNVGQTGVINTNAVYK